MTSWPRSYFASYLVLSVTGSAWQARAGNAMESEKIEHNDDYKEAEEEGYASFSLGRDLPQDTHKNVPLKVRSARSFGLLPGQLSRMV